MDARIRSATRPETILITKFLRPAAIAAACVSAVAAAANDDPAIPPRVPAVFPATWNYPAGAKATFTFRGEQKSELPDLPPIEEPAATGDSDK